METIRHFLGLDWGASKVGVALADGETRMAFRVAIFKNDARIFERLRALVREHRVETVTVGVPAHYAHAREVGESARHFGERVGRECDVRVVFFQEMFTTKMAQANLAQSGATCEDDDAEAARLILQEWLDISGKL
jgi:putative transcription antitermination factor YqgF